MTENRESADALARGRSSSGKNETTRHARSGVSRRKFLRSSAAAGVAVSAASSGVAWKGAIAQSKRLVVTTMPGSRWEQALKASAEA